jgi:hypothetical protein
MPSIQNRATVGLMGKRKIQPTYGRGACRLRHRLVKQTSMSAEVSQKVTFAAITVADGGHRHILLFASGENQTGEAGRFAEMRRVGRALRLGAEASAAELSCCQNCWH